MCMPFCYGTRRVVAQVRAAMQSEGELGRRQHGPHAGLLVYSGSAAEGSAAPRQGGRRAGWLEKEDVGAVAGPNGYNRATTDSDGREEKRGALREGG